MPVVMACKKLEDKAGKYWQRGHRIREVCTDLALQGIELRRGNTADIFLMRVTIEHQAIDIVDKDGNVVESISPGA